MVCCGMKHLLCAFGFYSRPSFERMQDAPSSALRVGGTTKLSKEVVNVLFLSLGTVLRLDVMIPISSA